MTTPRWKVGLKTANDKVWKGLDAVGAQVNHLSNKVGSEAFWPQPMDLEIEKCSRILRTLTTKQLLEKASIEGKAKTPQKVLVQIPPKLLQNAKGLAIFTVCRTGLGLSAASGRGVVIARNPDGSWGSPSGILIHTIGFGFLAGADIYDVVLILRNQKAVNVFGNPKVSIGAELTVTAGPVGAGAMVDAGYEAAPVLSYVKSRGIYGGIQLDGNIIIERNDENARFYGRKIKAKEILAGNIARPLNADLLVATIESAEGRHIEPTYTPSSPSSSTNAEDLQASVNADDDDERIRHTEDERSERDVSSMTSPEEERESPFVPTGATARYGAPPVVPPRRRYLAPMGNDRSVPSTPPPVYATTA